jgi:two-component system, chemotaxis family, CheB/CheR fusion protein
MRLIENETSNISDKDTLIIGVGASAGGLEALYSLFCKPLPSNLSFIVIQHLSPNFKSITGDLLASHCHQQVVTIENNMQVEANRIYVLSERKKVEIDGDKLILTELDPNTTNNTLDIFFTSLAAEKGDKSIGIVLSGGGEDGTMGAGTIKKEGGIVLVQDPATAQFSSMPLSVIAAGYADSILAPELLADEIANYLENNIVLKQFTDNNEKLLLEVLVLISKHSPLDFSNYKRATIIRRIIRKMNQNNISSLPGFIKFLENNPSEIDSLSKEFMISVTKFFRDPAAFEFLEKKVLPDIIAKKEHNESLKLWVIGCATGEEAYSIAILIQEKLEENKKSMEVKIFASDIDKDALSVASKGIYPESIVNDISPERLSKYFTRQGKKYKVKDYLRNMLIIAQHDITRHPPYYKLDLISCRNLLIYLNPALQKRILATLHYCLNTEGYLFLGPSESIGDLKSNLSEENKKWKIYKNIQPAKRIGNGTYSIPSFYVKPSSKAMPIVRTAKLTLPNYLDEIVAETLSQKTNHAVICIDEDYKILKTFGEYKKYLLPEMFNFNLLHLLPHELSIITATALTQVTKEKKDLTIKDVTFTQDEVSHSVTLYIKLFPGHKYLGKTIFVFFIENGHICPEENSENFNKELHTSHYLLDLEETLRETQKKLDEAHESLEVINLHAQSFNEDLVSGNEELQSTNEEVQSVNEELHTVNSQYQIKIKELTELNDDLNNYFGSTINGLIFVDRDFIIRKFTPSAIKQINLKESDIGRPISDLSTNIKFSTMAEDMNRVISSSCVIEKEIEMLDHNWYQMVLSPYLRQDNQTDGLIISFNEITDLKMAQKKLMKINEDHNTFIYSVSHDLNAPISNIQGLIGALGGIVDSGNEEIKETLNLINLSVIKLKETVKELSDITKIEKESSDEISESVNINDLVNEIKISIDSLLQKSKAKIITDFEEQEINFPKKNLRSILLNLLTNAIKYKSPERDPEITIRVEKEADYIILTVTDNGMGISKENKSKIFSMFKRVHEEKNIEGTGIGLYLIKKMIVNSGGEIKVKSEQGKGSAFKVYFKKSMEPVVEQD